MRPVLFHVFGLPIHAYGFMLACGFLAGLVLARKNASKFRGINPDDVTDMLFLILILAIVGARLAFVLNDWHAYSQSPGEIFKIWSGGLSFHGGFIGGALGVFLFSRKKKISFFEMADLCSPSLALGYMFGRAGCWLNGCCYGRPSEAPWAMAVPSLHDHVLRHPTQIYSILMNFVIVLILLGLRPHRKFAGDLTAAYFILYAVERFVMEVYRMGSSSIILSSGLTEAQYVSFLMAGIGLAIFIGVRKMGQPVGAKGKAKGKA